MRAITVASLALTLLPSAPALAGHFSLNTISPTGATFARSVNDRGQVVGHFVTSGSQGQESIGFVWQKGTLTQVTITGNNPPRVYLQAVNNRGVVVGNIDNGNGVFSCFTYVIASQQITPCARKDGQSVAGTVATAISDKNAVAGFFDVSPKDPPLYKSSFVGYASALVRRKYQSDVTRLSGVNASGLAAGFVIDGASGPHHGFTLKNGTFSLFDYPGASGTQVSFLNNAGIIGGTFSLAAGGGGAFTLSNGTYAAYNYPGQNSTTVVGVGQDGSVFGNYFDTQLSYHAFVYRSGTYYPLDVPGATQTYISSVSDKGAIAGYYTANTNGLPNYGFAAFCAPAQAPCTSF